MAMANDSFGGGKGRFQGSEPVNFSIAQTIPGSPGFFSPIIPTQGNNLGDTIYALVSNIFDPRVLQNITSGADVYSGSARGYDYARLAEDFMYRLLFEKFRMRTAPEAAVIADMIACIADISRMLGIYLTALTMLQSRDPEMFARARALELNNTFAEMQSMLQYLPLPSNIAKTAVKYIRLMDVSAKDNYQNIGFLVNGDYNAFVSLAAAVRSRPLALNFLRQLYPEIGVIGDPGSQYNADVMEAFANCNMKAGVGGFAPYITVEGSSGEVQALNSFGCLSTVQEGSGRTYAVTGWAAPGSGIAGAGSVRTFVPSICRWKDVGRDAAIIYSGAAQTYAVAGADVTFETVVDPALASNVCHEYNMAYDDTIPAFNWAEFNTSTGAVDGASALAQEDVRYRVSAGFSLAKISYRLDGNTTTGIYSMLAM